MRPSIVNCLSGPYLEQRTELDINYLVSTVQHALVGQDFLFIDASHSQLLRPNTLGTTPLDV